MKLDFPLTNGLSLQIASGSNGDASYPSARIQKGLILLYEEQELCEEAVGFGVPILKRGLQTIFPSELELYLQEGNPAWQIYARYKLNLVEKIAKSTAGTVSSPLVYASKNYMAALIRQLPILRRLLTRTSDLLRSKLSWKTTYEPSQFSTDILLSYSINTQNGKIAVELDRQGHYPEGTSEVIVMNEQGARYFDQYLDTDGIARLGSEIGCWDQVFAEEASFVNRKHQIMFSLPRVNGARLYRGRELIGTRLAWSGFGYTFSPSLDRFGYEITIKRPE